MKGTMGNPHHFHHHGNKETPISLSISLVLQSRLLVHEIMEEIFFFSTLLDCDTIYIY